MAYEVLARKWRPKTFDDVVGQDHVVQTLRHAIEIKRLAHAYLFVGPRGIGKTSIARIFAKALNCKEGPTPRPCCLCDACREIAAGTNLDVLEIDGASNNSVDQVRDLRDTVKYLPTSGTFKIYIIDEVHMLSASAFNALLKTLEEPPAHVKFIFATTDPHKILPTVISRCQRFDLRRIPLRLLVDKLRAVAQAEGAEVGDDALLAVARVAEGSLRDAESSLDQLIAFRGNRLVEEDVLSVFGLVGRAHLETLARGILAGDLRVLLGVLAGLDDAGKDMQRLLVELIAYFRHLLVCLSVDDMTLIDDMTDEQLAVLRELAGLTQATRVLRVVEILSESEERIRGALSRRSILETALIRCARAANCVTLEEVLAKLNALRRGEGPPAAEVRAAAPVAAVRAAVGSPAVAPSKAPVIAPVVAPVAAPAVVPVPEVAPASVPPALVPPAAGSGVELGRLQKAWPEVGGQVTKLALNTRGKLADARPLAVTGDRVTVGFDPEFEEEAGLFRTGRGRMALESILGTLLKRKVTVEIVLAELGKVLPEDAVEEEKGAEAPPGRVVAGKGGRNWAEDPAVNMALEVLGGKIVDVRE